MLLADSLEYIAKLVVACFIKGSKSKIIIRTSISIIGPLREKTCLRWFANNTGADQSTRMRSLISAFVIRFLESIIFKLDTGEISIS